MKQGVINIFYTEKINLALKIAFEAHKNQVDKNGTPYVFHPYELATKMETENEIILALLHDVVEDSDMTLGELREMGFDGEIIEALSLLTHDERLSYEDYIERIKENQLARCVKLADLAHNSNENRLAKVDSATKKRLAKYQRAIEVLNTEE